MYWEILPEHQQAQSDVPEAGHQMNWTAPRPALQTYPQSARATVLNRGVEQLFFNRVIDGVNF